MFPYTYLGNRFFHSLSKLIEAVLIEYFIVSSDYHQCENFYWHEIPYLPVGIKISFNLIPFFFSLRGFQEIFANFVGKIMHAFISSVYYKTRVIPSTVGVFGKFILI